MTKKKHTYNNEIAPKKGFVVTDNHDKITWTTGRKHYVDIPKDFKDKHIMKLWCEQNCQYPVVYYTDRHDLKWKKGFDVDNFIARVYFFAKEDAMAFKLRWI